MIHFWLLVLVSLSAMGKVENYTIHPGEVRWLEFKLTDPSAKFFCLGEEHKMTVKDGVGQAIVVESYFSELKPFQCHVEEKGKTTLEFHFTVENKEYKAEQLKVDPKRIKLNEKDEKRAAEEQVMLNKIYASSLPEFQFQKAFMQPLTSAVTSIYGIKRVYNNQKKGQHLGIDYRASVGDKVPAANRGKVVYAGDLFYTGYTVIIDHGLDIYTVYGHLSKPLVEAGKMVERGDLIGLSGNTGRTSGPHLHWGVKVQGQYIDGMVLIDETKKFFRD